MNYIVRDPSLSKDFSYLENTACFQVEKYLLLQQELNNVLRNYSTKQSYFKLGWTGKTV